MVPISSELGEITLSEIQQGLASGAYTARSLVEEYLGRIETIDYNGLALRSIIETNPDVFAIAHELDREHRLAEPRGALHGVPILIKDNIDTGDRMMTTAGSLALDGSPALNDAFLVQPAARSGRGHSGKGKLE
jgi:amidase